MKTISSLLKLLSDTMDTAKDSRSKSNNADSIPTIVLIMLTSLIYYTQDFRVPGPFPAPPPSQGKSPGNEVDDVNISVLTAQMEILQVLLKDGDYFCFDDNTVKIKELTNPEREMRKEVITLCKLILVNPATSAAGERSFSTARRLKTWLRSRMNQERFSNLTVLN